MTVRGMAGVTVAVVAVVAVVLWGGSSRWPAAADAGVPTARVARGTLTLDIHITGEFRATRSMRMTAPAAETPVRLISLAETGTTVRAGDVVMEFDPVDQLHELEQSRSELLEAEQEIAKLRADADVQAAEAQTELLTARFDVRRAELDTLGGAQFLGRIEMERRELAVEEARRQLAELEEALPSKSATNRAALAVLEEKRTQARLTADRAQQIIDNLVVRAPLDGVVIVRENRDATTVLMLGMTVPDYQVGNTAFFGRTVLEIVDVGELEISASVPEDERPNVEVGQSAVVFVDGQAKQALAATVDAVAGMATSGDFFFFGSGPLRAFDVVLTLDAPDDRLRPGNTAQVVVDGRELDDVLYLPPQAIFEVDGRTTAYVEQNGTFDSRSVTVIGRSAGRVAVEGVAEGEEVALVDPQSRKPRPAATAVTGVRQ